MNEDLAHDDGARLQEMNGFSQAPRSACAKQTGWLVHASDHGSRSKEQQETNGDAR